MYKARITGPKIDSASTKLLTFSGLLDKTVKNQTKKDKNPQSEMTKNRG